MHAQDEFSQHGTDNRNQLEIYRVGLSQSFTTAELFYFIKIMGEKNNQCHGIGASTRKSPARFQGI